MRNFWFWLSLINLLLQVGILATQWDVLRTQKETQRILEGR